MDSIYNITIKAFNQIASENRPFSVKMVAEEVARRGGMCRVAPGVTIGEYFETKCEKGYLTYAGDDLYLPTKKTLAAFSASPALIEHGYDIESLNCLEDLQLILDSKSEDEYEIRKILRNRQKRQAGIF